MKANIHPKVNKVVFLDVMSGAEFITTSTLKSEETKKIDGVEHFVIRVETSSASHPFYTGKKRNDVRNDQVAKYMARVAKAQEKNKPKVVGEDGESEKEAPAKKTTTSSKVAKAKKK